jgi:hypothetical protein
VLFYIVKISESCFVWATSPLWTGAIIEKRKETVWVSVGNRIRQVELVQNVTHTDNIFSIRTQHIWHCIRMTVTCAHGLVVTPDWFVETALSSSLLPVKAQFFCLYLWSVKDFLFFKYFFTTCFLLVKNTYKHPYYNSWSPVNRWIEILQTDLLPLFEGEHVDYLLYYFS